MSREGIENREQVELFEKEFSLDNNIENADRMAILTKEELVKLGWPASQAEDFSVAVQEAIMNAILHGNLNIDKKDGEVGYEERIHKAQDENENKRVRIYLRFSKNDATAKVNDEGKYVPDTEKMKNPTEGDLLLQSSGKGLFLILSLCDNVAFSEGEVTLHSQKKEDDWTAI